MTAWLPGLDSALGGLTSAFEDAGESAGDALGGLFGGLFGGLGNLVVKLALIAAAAYAVVQVVG